MAFVLSRWYARFIWFVIFPGRLKYVRTKSLGDKGAEATPVVLQESI